MEAEYPETTGNAESPDSLLEKLMFTHHENVKKKQSFKNLQVSHTFIFKSWTEWDTFTHVTGLVCLSKQTLANIEQSTAKGQVLEFTK